MKGDSLKVQAAQIFLRASEYIRKNGWQVEGMGEMGKPRCSMGALRSAHRAVVWDKQLAELMYQSLNDELSGLSLTRFNARFKSGEKVASLYERAASRLLNRNLSPL